MITILVNLNAGCDDHSLNRLLSLKAVIVLPYWKDFEKTMYIEFQFFIENDIWKYKNVLSD